MFLFICTALSTRAVQIDSFPRYARKKTYTIFRYELVDVLRHADSDDADWWLWLDIAAIYRNVI